MLDLDDHIVRDIYKSVTRGYEWLFKEGRGYGHWKSVEHTALVSLALTHREPKNSPWSIAARDWLFEQQEELDADTLSWDEEVIDTSMALMALLRIGVLPSDPRIRKAFNFLHKLYQANGRPNWEDEPWETSWSILAISEGNGKELLDEACQATKWLMGLQDASGAIIAPHYTSFYVKIIDTMSKRQGTAGYCLLDQGKFKASSKLAVDYLMRNFNEDKLWTGLPRSNGFIIYALATSNNFPFHDQMIVNQVVDWFLENQEPDGNWYDNEDTASAIIGLVSLLRGYVLFHSQGVMTAEDVNTAICNHLRRMYDPPKPNVGHKMVTTNPDGSTSINLSPNIKKILTVVLSAAGTFTVLIALWDFLKDYFGW